MEPGLGNFTMVLDTGAALATPTYAADGLGAVTTTEADSFVKDATRSLLTALHSTAKVGGTVTVWHGANATAGGLAVKAAVLELSTIGTEPLDVGEGIRLLGNWYIETTIAAPKVTALFKTLD